MADRSPTPSLRLRLMLYTGLLVLLGLAVQTAANVWIARASALRTLDAVSLALAHAHAEAIAQWVDTRLQVVASLAPRVHDADPLPALQLAAAAGRLDLSYVGFADRRVMFSRPQQLPPGYDPTSRPWYQQAVAAQGPVLTAPYLDASTGKPVVTAAFAVREGQRLVAVAAGDMHMDGVLHNIASIRPTPGTRGFIVDRDGRLMVHEDLARLGQPLAQIAPALDPARLPALAQARQLTPLQIEGEARLLQLAPIAGTSWWLAIALPRDEALAGVQRMVWSASASSIVIAVLAVLVIGSVLAASLRPLSRLRGAMDDASSGEGDLTQRLPTSGAAELAGIAAGFNRFSARLQAMLLDIRASADSIGTASSQIASGNHDLSHRTEQTASNLQQTASSMAALTATVRQSADAAQHANQLAGSAAEVAQRGGGVVGELVTTMQEIQHSSQRIADIIGVIDGIAFQTNILALNAAVEAARAGEQGRGFAVVASEVRQLAQRSADAAKEIKQLIGSSVGKVAAGSTLVQTTGSTMQEIVQSVQRVSDIVGEISAATREQSQEIHDVNGAVSALDQMTQQNAALVEQSTAAAQSLREQAERLRSAVGAFRLA